MQPVPTPAILQSPAGRQKLVAFALELSAGTSLAPDSFEYALLLQFEAGALRLDQFIALLALRGQGAYTYF